MTDNRMSIMQQNRQLAEEVAQAAGYFWKPCPLCKQNFGGHEWTQINGHESSIPKDWTTDEMGIVELKMSTGICPDCTFQGLGCKRTLEIGFAVHEDCEFMAAHLRKLRGHRD